MFHSARLTLTAWYLLIIMGISIIFSYVIYTQINQELTGFELFQKARQERMEKQFQSFGLPPPFTQYENDLQEIASVRNRLIATLIIINAGILLFSGGAGYFLAGRTLIPIQAMVDSQNRFIADASHEIRTPLTALKTSLEVNLREKNLTQAQIKELLRSNLEEVNTLQTLSDDLILLATYQQPGKLFEKINIKEVLEHAIHTVSPLAKKKQITITSQLKEVIVEGERKALQELSVIFLDNAIKYSGAKTTVAIRNMKRNGNVLITIQDQGVGIEKKDIPHIFDRFYRGEESRTRKKVTGYGLGLSIAQNILERHKGSVDVVSKVNKGTTFTITLPLKKAKKFG